ncbi:hypothetical protein [Rhizocola hellebori]|uniref:hypothetical protein n=1 Tax=Rhizocola hellebori TaxID=1392758 RepID=UPI0019419A00|nr:hypothetical protein [Rhizocola hellebori]
MLTLVFCAGLVGLAVLVANVLEDKPPVSARSSGTPGPARSPREGDPISVYQDWVREKVGETLARQRESLLSGDEAGYLSVLDAQAAKADRDRLAVQFKSLRAMKVADWHDKPSNPIRKDGDLWRIELDSSPCFVTDGCADASALADTVWRVVGATATLVEWAPDDKEPHPWQTSELVAQAGQRTIVATVKSQAGKLPSVLVQAEKAALVADRFARDGKPPSRYVIYWAPKKEWERWFDWNPPEWSGGAAIEVSTDRYELVLNADGLDPSAVDDLLRHELTHAASLPGRIAGGKELWWLTEGIAEIGEMEGSPVSAHSGIQDVAAIAKDSDGLEVTGPSDNAANKAVSGLYAFAFLGARCISERFGEPKLVEFFHAVVHDRRVASQAAPEVLDISWPDLQRDCLAYIRQAAG